VAVDILASGNSIGVYGAGARTTFVVKRFNQLVMSFLQGEFGFFSILYLAAKSAFEGNLTYIGRKITGRAVVARNFDPLNRIEAMHTLPGDDGAMPGPRGLFN